MVTWTKDFAAERYGNRSGIQVGEHSYGTFRLRGRGESLTIGRYCSLAEGLTIFLGGQHRTDFVTTYPFNVLPNWPSAKGIKGHPASRGPVVIGNDVWIGSGVTIVQGVTIGDGAVIGACSVVAKDVAPYAIHVGNPARFVRHRFDPATIEALLDLRWWDWPDDKVARAVPDLMSDDMTTFLTRARSGAYGAWCAPATTRSSLPTTFSAASPVQTGPAGTVWVNPPNPRHADAEGAHLSPRLPLQSK